MTDAEKVELLADAMQRIIEASKQNLSDLELASVALSYATFALRLVGVTSQPPLSDEAVAYGRDVVAGRIAQRTASPSK